jgi:hypothetical protein
MTRTGFLYCPDIKSLDDGLKVCPFISCLDPGAAYPTKIVRNQIDGLIVPTRRNRGRPIPDHEKLHATQSRLKRRGADSFLLCFRASFEAVARYETALLA